MTEKVRLRPNGMDPCLTAFAARLLPANGAKPDVDAGRDSGPSAQNTPPTAIRTSVITSVFDAARFIDKVRQACASPGQWT